MFNGITLLHPWLLLLLLFIPLYVAWYVWRRRTAHATMQVSTLKTLGKAGSSWRTKLRLLPMVLRLLAFALIVVVLPDHSPLSATATTTPRASTL